MADPPTSSGGPKFRIVAGRSLGERPSSGTGSSPLPQELKPPTMMPPSSMHMQHSQHPQPMQAQPQLVVQPTQGLVNTTTGKTMQMSQPQSSQSNTSQTLSTSDSQGMVTKCVRFFKTLIQLSQQPEQQQPSQNPHQTAHLVKELVSTLVFGQMPAEEFTTRLQSALKSQAQPHLLPFLHKTLPYLRAAMRNGEVTIEGVVPPPGVMVPTSQQIEAVSPQQPMHMQMQPQQHIITAQQQPSSTHQHNHPQPIQVQLIPQQPHYPMHNSPAQVDQQQHIQMHTHQQQMTVQQQPQQVILPHSQHQQHVPIVAQQIQLGQQQHMVSERPPASQGMIYAPTSGSVSVVSVPIQNHIDQSTPMVVDRADASVAGEPMDDSTVQQAEEEMIQVRQLQEGALEVHFYVPPIS